MGFGMRNYLPDLFVAFRILIRARFLAFSALLIVIMCLASGLASFFSGRQPATVALDVGLSVVRMLLPLILVLMTQELISREIERRYYLESLSYPRSRHVFLFGRFVGIFVFVFFLLFLAAGVLALLVGFVRHGYSQATAVALDFRYLVTIFFIGVDLFVIASVTFLLAVFASAPSFVLFGALGFMLIARSYAAVIELLAGGQFLVGGAEGYRAGLGLLVYVFPDLGALDVRAISLYSLSKDFPSDWFALIVSNVFYAFFMLTLAVIVLRHKRFI